MIKKKKRRLKKWVKISLFLMFTFLFVLILYFTNSSNTSISNQKSNSAKEELQKYCKKIDYCIDSYQNRYMNYYQKHKTLSFDDIITRVNIGLDYPFYTHSKKATHLDKEYVLVNKYLYLNKDYTPNNLEIIPEEYARSGMRLVSYAKESFVKMARQARLDGITIIAMSSYRSYQYQVNLYNRYVESDGKKAADSYSARAGFSEHQTGLCVDIYDGDLDYTHFERSDSFDWMMKNAYRYGFILRFPKDMEHITGYQYESWHYRYVGKKVAKYIHDHHITFEEYYTKFIEPKFKE